MSGCTTSAVTVPRSVSVHEARRAIENFPEIIEDLAWLPQIVQVIVSGYPNSKAYIDRLVEH